MTDWITREKLDTIIDLLEKEKAPIKELISLELIRTVVVCAVLVVQVAIALHLFGVI